MVLSFNVDYFNNTPLVFNSGMFKLHIHIIHLKKYNSILEFGIDCSHTFKIIGKRANFFIF